MGQRRPDLSNVIRLADFRSRKQIPPSRTIFYIHGKNEKWISLLNSFSLLRTEGISSSFELSSGLYLRKPDLVLLESDLDWVNPLHLIEELHHLLDVPLVLIYDPKKSQKGQVQIKQAYSVGLYDVLFAPLQKEDLLETLEVLLKFKLQSSLNQ